LEVDANWNNQVVLSASASGSMCCATVCSARSNCRGNAFPLFSARRSIPAHAFELKKNRCGIEVCSSTCDNEHTLASLGQSEMLGVEDAPRDCSRGSINKTSVRPSAPWRDERFIFTGKSCQKAPEGVIFGVEDSGDVFPEDDGGSMFIDCICDLTKG
jgi:hypothetical protein